LRKQLIQLYKDCSSPALRQALYHLDILLIIQSSFKKSQMTAPECLTVTSLAANSAHKLLEQTYRFCLKKEDVFLGASHDLKRYHRELYPKFTSYPPSVRQLSLAGHWAHYFYAEYQSWLALTTQVVDIPPVLNPLVGMAEGRALSPDQLEKFISEMIEDACKHTEALLSNMKPSDQVLPPVLPAPVRLEESLKLKSGVFASVSDTLNQFLVRFHPSPDHPVYARIKQALAPSNDAGSGSAEDE
jgi:hypothetical protein